eukprot:4647588-Heterocapsa_arctica.AAC.1
MAAVREPNCLLWASMHCVEGSPWQNLNRLRTGGQAKVDVHILLFNKIPEKSKHVAHECIKHGGRVAIEWPRSAQCNGCAVGLINDNGAPIKKPWTIATNDGHLWRAMSDCKCPGKAVHPNHQPCAGKYNRLTEEYTWPMTDLVHIAWRSSTYAMDKGLETPEAK